MLLGRFYRPIGNRHLCIVITCIICIFLSSTATPLADSHSKEASLRSRVYRLRNVTAEEVKKQLELLEIGTKIDIFRKDALIVTAVDGDDLSKASSIVKMIDSKEKYEIRAVGNWTSPKAFGISDSIAEKVGKTTIGTFTAPPSDNGVIVDVHNSRVIAIAPASLMGDVTTAVSDMLSPPTESETRAVATNVVTRARKLFSNPTPQTVPDAEPRVTDNVNISADVKIESNQIASADFFQAELFQSLADAENRANTTKNQIAAIDSARPVLLAQATDSKSRLDQIAEAKASQAEKETEKKTAPPAEKKAEETGKTREEEIMGRLMQLVNSKGDEPEEETAEDPKTDTKPKIDTDPKTVTPPRTTDTVRPPVNESPVPKPPVMRGPTPKVTGTDPEMAALKAENERLRKALAEGKGTPIADNDAAAEGESKTEEIPTVDAVAEKELNTVMMLPERVQITALIELIAEQMGLNYLYDAKLVTGDVTIKLHAGKIKVKDAYALLETVLKFKNLAMSRRGNIVHIVPVANVADIDPVLRKNSGEIQPGDVIVTQVFKLEHITTATAQTMLQNMKLGISFMPIEDTKTLVVTGFAYRMERMEEILNMIDIKGKERKFESRKLEYILPSTLATKLQTLAQELGTISITVNKQTPTTVMRPPTTTTRTSTSRTVSSRTITPPRPTTTTPQQPTAQSVYLDTDDRTNRILMVGLIEDIETVNMLIDSLDVEKFGLMSIKEYPIRFVEATEIIDSLSELGVIAGTSSRSSMSSRSPISSRPTTTTTTRTPTTTIPTTTYSRTPTAQGGEDGPMISVRMSTNSLLVNATDEQHAEIAMVIKFVDVEQTDLRAVQEYEIQYVDTTEVVDTLSELGIIAPQQSSSSRRSSSTTPTSRTATTPTTPAATAATTTFASTTGAEITSDQPQIAVLESTNSLLVYATPKQHETIEIVVKHVDREITTDTTPYVVYELENQDPVELAATLNDIVQATVKEAEKPKDSKVTTVAVPRLREKNEIQIVPDEQSHSLIIYADKKNQQWLSVLIEQLDSYRPQVHLDVTLVEITKDNEFNYDLDIVTKLPQMALGGSMQSGGLVDALVDPFPGSVFEASSTGGSGVAFYSDEHVQGLLEVVDSKNYGRILAKPSLLVKDNQTGEIKAEKTIYVGQEKSSIVPTTSDTSSTVTDVSFEAYTSGVTLSITPHIASDTILQLEITLDRTDFIQGTGETTIRGETFPKPLDTVASNVNTWAVLPSGATIILGGIESMNQSKGVQKIPILGDIPIIGMLFRGVDETDTQSKLYVFVKPNIIRPGDELTGLSDIEVISQKKRQDFEEAEDSFQGLQGVIPGVTPPPLAPVKILEEDDFTPQVKKGKRDGEPVSVEVKLEPSVYTEHDGYYVEDDAY